MKHLLLCPELPPAPLAPGGIGTYADHISKLLAQVGETVHVIAERWSGASAPVTESLGGRLIVHRVSLDEPVDVPWNTRDLPAARQELEGLARLGFPPHRFAWQAGLLAEKLVQSEAIDLIEAQEYSAPLYFFQLRRALGLGPARRPPCLVHLHSPWQYIVHHNDWDPGHRFFLRAQRLDAFTIAAADAWLCPSRYLARDAERRFGLKPGAIEVIPLPLGETSVPARDAAVWESGPVCYVGRLEARKGVLEWVDAVLAVADDHPSARFELIGGDLPYTGSRSVGEHLRGRIPERLRGRIAFLGSLPREQVQACLARARIAAVPSRWENFPNTCVEAMARGLPVIATRHGGMAEMVEDEVSGWLAERGDVAGLAHALRRALETPPEELARMGQAAAEAIRELCANDAIVARHLELRARVAARGAARSCALPPLLPWAHHPFEHAPEGPRADDRAEGLAVVVVCSERGDLLEHCFEALALQTRRPLAVAVVVPPRGTGIAPRLLAWARERGWIVRERRCSTLAEARNTGIEAILAQGTTPLGFVFLDAADQLAPGFLEACDDTLRRQPRVALVFTWLRQRGAGDRLIANPCPSLPYQLLEDETTPATAVRTRALEEAGRFRAHLESGYESWDLANAVLAAGWVAVTFPRLLAERWASPPGAARTPAHARMLRDLLERVHDVVQRDAGELLLLLGSPSRHAPAGPRSEAQPMLAKPSQRFGEALRTQREVIALALREPRLVAGWLRRSAAKAWRRLSQAAAKRRPR